QFFFVGRYGLFVYGCAMGGQPGGKALRLPQVFFYRGGAFFFLLQKGGKGTKPVFCDASVFHVGVNGRSPFTQRASWSRPLDLSQPFYQNGNRCSPLKPKK